MEQKVIFRQLLGELKEAAEQRGGKIAAKEVEDYLAHAGLRADQLELVFEYLTDQKIRVEGYTDRREKAGRFGDYLPQEEEGQDAAYDEGNAAAGAGDGQAAERTEGSAKSWEDTDEEGMRSALEIYLEEIASVKQVDPLIELEVYHKAAGGDKGAREQIMSALLPVVCDLASEMETEGIAVEDLIQEGNMELWMALEQMEAEETLAAYQARLMNKVSSAMEEVLRRSADVRDMDRGMVSKVRRLDEAIRALKEELGRRPTAEELSAFLEMPLDEIVRTLKLASG